MARAFQDILQPVRYKVYWGGRGAAKSWTVARTLIAIAHQRKVRIGCFRELQTSIKDSVHQILKDQIELMGLTPWFEITLKSIRSRRTGAEFLFKGLRGNTTEIKSTEGIDIAWVEEAQLVSKSSWELLTPTIRKKNSQIWITFNPVEEEDPTYQKFVVNPPPNSIVKKVGWRDNPWFTEQLNEERLWMEQTDPDAYQHVWEGACRVMSDAVIFRNKYEVAAFEIPEYPIETILLHGMDFGFANDPSCLLRAWITTGEKIFETVKGIKTCIGGGDQLWIDEESYGFGVEIDELPQLMDKIPTARKWPIKADCARPETISYLHKRGFNISGAEKWNGSIEDGIAHLKSFGKIHINQRCKHLLQEARLYSYKRDRVTEEVLPIVIDKNNHGWDSLRYALDKHIKRGGEGSKWARMG